MTKRFSGVFILSDMDGTLLNSHSQISMADMEALEYFMEEGGLFSVATGRALRSVQGFLPGLRTSAPSIVHNGSLITSLETGATVRRVDLWPGVTGLVEEVLEHYQNVGVEVCLPDDQYVARGNCYSERHHKRVGLCYKLRDYKEIPLPWLKLNLTGDHEILDELKDNLLAKYGENIFAQFSLPYYYEIMAPGGSKGDSAIWLQEYLKVRPEDFYTVGDGTNDLELIRASGKNSHAPSNAQPEILIAASNILPDNDSGCIAELIRRLDRMYY